MFKKFKEWYGFLVVASKIKELIRGYMENKEDKGIKTTEFITTVISIIGVGAAFFMAKLSPETSAMVVGIMVASYNLARGIAKITKTTKDDEILDLVEKKIIEKLNPIVK